ncbi:hypothetical protein GCM10027277_49180 [Pseudoduganella ginsengisoli]|uniref:Carboxypeptidase regulatory-like domain-containing protein n=1 Tax=Pseudoduganella ginsengisoli TaxID=1462440 RepID=A0A6L6Q504_9BURK|nr:carboxypeptidase-like regulatory domain-containing protein [Pseudoduganella ginsengisoli]MTW04539.1 hypothetical protein [Pseudoduganella ginsengisoli]
MPTFTPCTSSRFFVACAVAALLSACGGDSNTDSQPRARQGGLDVAPGAEQPVGNETVKGEVRGLNGVIATVVLSDQAKLLMTTETDPQGRFQFTGVPYGAAFVKVEAEGYQLSPPQSILVSARKSTLSTLPSQRNTLVFSATTADAGSFQFVWNNVTGAQETGVPQINAAPVIKYLDEPVPAPNYSAGANLLFSYNVTLSDKGVKWNQEYAARLLTTLGTIPTRYLGQAYTAPPFRISKWELTDQYIDGDIRIDRKPGGDAVVLSTAAFVYATPRLVTLDGVQGRYFSKRLHHALVRFATQDGTDADAAEQVLNQRFGVSTRIDDYSRLTAYTTKENADKFAPFKPDELVRLINAMEEMPDTFHKIDGLKYVVRRGYGYTNPVDRRIIAQAYPAAGYIEFTDQALAESQSVSPQRIILHEKTHFLWANVFSAKQKDDWIKLGGWTRDPQDATKWRTTQTTQFVSAYGHDTNPEEDMAESVSSYVITPELLQSRAIDKFNYLKERIFLGDRFVSVIRKDLTFDVLNLRPDYYAPGLVKQLKINVTGAPAADKTATASIELFSDSDPSPGATQCMVELTAPSGNWEHRKNLYFWPTLDDGTRRNGSNVNKTVLTAELNFSKYAERGYWQLTRGNCVDVAGNVRYLGADELGNGAIYINNPEQSPGAPKYEPGSMKITATPVLVDGHLQHRVTATWKMLPHPLAIMGPFAQLANIDTLDSRVYLDGGGYDPATRTATATFTVPSFYKSGRFGVMRIVMDDAGENRLDMNFPDAASGEQPVGVNIVNQEADGGEAPELDLNRMTVSATPTQPSAPNGETIVKVAFYVRDDGSGFANLYLNLQNPQGQIFPFYLMVDPANPGSFLSGFDYSTTPFKGDPKAWRRYEAIATLPVGSVPGQWGIRNMFLADKAGFGKYYEFVELMHFEVSGK